VIGAAGWRAKLGVEGIALTPATVAAARFSSGAKRSERHHAPASSIRTGARHDGFLYLALAVFGMEMAAITATTATR
jgi:hypothetical protein